MELPVGILVTGAVSCGRSRAGFSVDAVERKITVNQPDLVRVGFEQFAPDLSMPALAVRALVVAEFDDGDGRIGRAEGWVVVFCDVVTGHLLGFTGVGGVGGRFGAFGRAALKGF